MKMDAYDWPPVFKMLCYCIGPLKVLTAKSYPNQN